MTHSSQDRKIEHSVNLIGGIFHSGRGYSHAIANVGRLERT